MNSWDKSDSYENYEVDFENDCEIRTPYYRVGVGDLSLMKKLIKAGTDHRKFMRMITVYVDITAPMYWWKEMDTYKVGTVRNSCSTMHKIQAKEFTIYDFSYEHLIDEFEDFEDLVGITDEDDQDLFVGGKDCLLQVVKYLNTYREKYIETKDKKYWWQMIQLLPSSYNQKSTVMLNYEVLANMYKSRKNHKLDEWHDFCHWIESLPYSELITGEYENENQERI
jgi:hypothetical protein